MARIPELFSGGASDTRAILLAAHGFVGAARESIAEAEAIAMPPHMANPFLDLARALVEYADGKTDDAIALLESLIQREEAYGILFFGGYYYYASEVLASAWLSQGNPGEAVRVLKRAVGDKPRPDPEGPGSLTWMRIQLRLALLYRQSGQETQADEIENKIRALLAYADDDHWMVRYLEGTAEFQRLIIEGPEGEDLAASGPRMNNLP